jgi:hypothetical protein
MKSKGTPANVSGSETAKHSGEAEKLKKSPPQPGSNKPAGSASPSAPATGGGGFASIVSQQTYNQTREAAILSILETCRRLKVPVRDYQASILPGLANFPIDRVALKAKFRS